MGAFAPGKRLNLFPSDTNEAMQRRRRRILLKLEGGGI